EIDSAGRTKRFAGSIYSPTSTTADTIHPPIDGPASPQPKALCPRTASRSRESGMFDLQPLPDRGFHFAVLEDIQRTARWAGRNCWPLYLPPYIYISTATTSAARACAQSSSYRL